MSGLEPGSTLGGYRVLARLRAGAMGALYLARPVGASELTRPVALKVLHDHLVQNKRLLRMFVAEANLSARIQDRHVIHIEKVGEADGRYFLVMEFVHGVSLGQALAILRKHGGGLPVDVSVAIAIDIAKGLHAAHEATDENGQPLGIVHRDVSPHNVLVSYGGHVKVIDFGVAKARQTAGQTMTGSIRGKLAYMPPEQARSAKHVDRRADLYALGLVLWEMLAGRRLFQGKNDIELLNRIRDPVIVAPSAVNARVPKAVDTVVLQLLEQDPARRPATGLEVARLLAQASPPATKVRAADIATCMTAVRKAATGGLPMVAGLTEMETITASGVDEEHDDQETEDLLEEVKHNLTLFDQVTAARAPIDDEPGALDNNSTKVMAAPPVPSSVRMPPPPASSSGQLPLDPLPDFEEITKNHRISRPPGQAYPVLLSVEGPPPLSAFPKKEEAPRAEKTPLWLSGPVLGGLALVFIGLVVAFSMMKGGAPNNSNRTLTTSGTTPKENRTPLENAREAASEGNYTAARQYLEKPVRGGKAQREEVEILLRACMQMGDMKCVSEVSAKYPSVPRPTSLGPP